MSSKIGISPDEITTAIKALPAVTGAFPESDALSAAMDALQAAPKNAVNTRVIFYRYDDGPSAQADTFQAMMQGGTLPQHDVARELDCDLQMIELGSGPSDAVEAARACAFGMMAAEQDTGLLAVIGYGAGSMERASDPQRFFETATPEVAAMMGAMVAAARAGIPIIAEGPQGLAAARGLKMLNPGLAANVFICGVRENDPAFHVFADIETSDTGYAALMLAATLRSEFAKRKAA